MADIQIKVTPSVMKNQAGEISGAISKIRTNYERLKEIVNATTVYWQGDAANVYRSYIKDIDGDMQEVLKRLNEHPVDLLKMAQLYEEGETSAGNIASSLPTEVIT